MKKNYKWLKKPYLSMKNINIGQKSL